MPEDIPIPGIIPLASCRNCTLLTSALKVDTSWLRDLHKVRPFINDVRTEGSPMELIVPIGCVLVLVTRGGGSNIPKISQKSLNYLWPRLERKMKQPLKGLDIYFLPLAVAITAD